MICCLVRDPAGASASPGVLEQIARTSSPRVTPCGDEAVLFDAAGLSRICGPPEVIAREVAGQAGACGLTIRLAIAGTMTAAWVLAHARPGPTVVSPGGEAGVLAPLPLGWLISVLDLDRHLVRNSRSPRDSGQSGEPARMAGEPGHPPPLRRGPRVGGRNYRMAPGPPGGVPGEGGSVSSTIPADGEADRARRLRDYRERLATFERWGIRTCGDLAALPRADIHTRMGPVGVRLHQAASGEDVGPLVPADDVPVFGDRMELDWPIEGLEPLSFVLARQCDRLSSQLERADRGAVAIHTSLHLVTREVHERVLALPAPMRDARVLRTLILLDLESHPPPAAIDVVALRVDVTAGRIVQGSLLAPAVPLPEQVSTLIARLGALVGTDRVGAPSLQDTHDTRQCAMVPFRAPRDTMRLVADVPAGPTLPATEDDARPTVTPHLRRLRFPMAVRVTTEQGTPVRVVLPVREGTGGVVRGCAGPWRTSGAWWDLDRRSTWDRDEWDVELVDGSVYRLVRQRATGQWELDGIFD